MKPIVPFKVPDGYFDTLKENILQKTTIPYKQVFEGKENPFVIPKDFFEDLEQKILQKTSQQFPQKVPFTIPYAYFENLPKQILTKVHTTKPTFSTIFWDSIWAYFSPSFLYFSAVKKYALAFSFMFLSMYGVYLFWNNGLKTLQNDIALAKNENKINQDTKNPTTKNNKIQQPENTTQKKSELTLNLSNNDVSTIIKNQQNTHLKNKNNTFTEKNLDEQLDNISIADLEDYLNEELENKDILDTISQEQSVMMMEELILEREEHEENLRLQKEQEINNLLHEIQELNGL